MAEIGQEPTFSYLTDRSFGQRLDSETCPRAKACKSAEADFGAARQVCPLTAPDRSDASPSYRTSASWLGPDPLEAVTSYT
mgnify:FL=1